MRGESYVKTWRKFLLTFYGNSQPARENKNKNKK